VWATISPDVDVGDAFTEDVVMLEDDEVLPEVEDIVHSIGHARRSYPVIVLMPQLIRAVWIMTDNNTNHVLCETSIICKLQEGEYMCTCSINNARKQLNT
jgi:hypothetical protein